MGRRLKRMTGEVAAYTVVNIVGTIVSLVIFNGLVHGVEGWFSGPMHARPLTTYVIANSVGMVVSYIGSRRFVFKHRHAAGPGDGFVGYVAVNLSSFVIPISCLWISRNPLHQASALSDNIAGNIVGALLATGFRYWAFKRFVFKPMKKRLWKVRRALSPHARPEIEGLGLGPEVGPLEAELVEHQSEQRDAEPDHVVRIAGHTGDEGAAQPVEGEGPRHAKRLTGGHVGSDFLVGDGGEPDLGRG
jgi:putative flippase GtrA